MRRTEGKRLKDYKGFEIVKSWEVDSKKMPIKGTVFYTAYVIDNDDDDWLYDDDEEYEEDESLHKIIMCSCN